MIKKDECILLGTIAKPHGTKGSLLLWLRNNTVENLKKKESVFVEIDGWLVPFFVETFQKNAPDTAILKIEEVDSEKIARTFAGYAVHILPEQVKGKKKSAKELPSLKGFRVTDMKRGFVGFAGEIAGNASNPLLQVIHEGCEFLVPVHTDIIVDVNDKTKEIRIDAPEGLFEI
jgi:16S rRNA processing protein RimM